VVSLARPCGRIVVGVGGCFMLEMFNVRWKAGDETLRLGGRWVGEVRSIYIQAEALRGGQGAEEPRGRGMSTACALARSIHFDINIIEDRRSTLVRRH
jgi:hypothetical protein